MLLAVTALVLGVSYLIYYRLSTPWPSRNTKQQVNTALGGNEQDEGDNDRTDIGATTTKSKDQVRLKSMEVNRDKSALEDRSSEDRDDAEDAATPKASATPTNNLPPIPSFSLASKDDSDDEDKRLPPPSFPALNSAQRASGPRSSLAPPASKPPPPKPQSASQLMPPPPRPVPLPQRTPNASTNGLRVPSTGPIPNRGRPTANNLTLPSGAPLTIPNPRQKVLLKPGHSPLDWAALQKSNKNLSGVPGFQRVTPSQLKFNNGRKGRPAWSSYQGRVYNIGPYLPFHPGGEGELRRAAGRDGEKLFTEVHPWVNWENMLGECCVGILVAEGQGQQESPLDDMD